MKITESRLRQMAIEELQLMVENGEIDEGFMGRMATRAKAGVAGLGGKIKGAAQRGVGKLAGAAGMEKVAAQAQKTGEKTSAAASKKSDAIKVVNTVQGHLKALMTDLEKLGVDVTQAGVKGPIGKLTNLAKTGKLAKAAGMAEPAAAAPAADRECDQICRHAAGGGRRHHALGSACRSKRADHRVGHGGGIVRGKR